MHIFWYFNSSPSHPISCRSLCLRVTSEWGACLILLFPVNCTLREHSTFGSTTRFLMCHFNWGSESNQYHHIHGDQLTWVTSHLEWSTYIWDVESCWLYSPLPETSYYEILGHTVQNVLRFNLVIQSNAVLLLSSDQKGGGDVIYTSFFNPSHQIKSSAWQNALYGTTSKTVGPHTLLFKCWIHLSLFVQAATWVIHCTHIILALQGTFTDIYNLSQIGQLLVVPIITGHTPDQLTLCCCMTFICHRRWCNLWPMCYSMTFYSYTRGFKCLKLWPRLVSWALI